MTSYNLLIKFKMKTRHLKTILLVAGTSLVVVLSNPNISSLSVGGVLVCIGEAVRIWAAGHLCRNRELTTSGPYAYLRDPLYLGRLFLIVGFCIMGWGYSLLLLPVGAAVFFLNYLPRKYRKEMSRLESIFGKEYRQYSSYARSLLPRINPYPNAEKRKWSFRVLWEENREQYFLLIIITVFAGIIIRFAFG